jgi:hypothetical protein
MDDYPNCARLKLDLQIREKIQQGSPEVDVPADGMGFWRWYKGWVNPFADIALRPVTDVPTYPPVTRTSALWYSGGCESTYCLDEIRKTEAPDLLSINDFELFRGRHRQYGQIHFLCAAIGAALGYRATHAGVERNDLLLSRVVKNDRYLGGLTVERTPEFMDRWTDYLGDRAFTSVCRDLTKEQLYLELNARGLQIKGTCDAFNDGTWCGSCFKCFEAYYSCKAIGLAPPTKLSYDAFDTFHDEYKQYLSSSFQMNVNNAQQYFLRLQVIYGVQFDRDRDCDPNVAAGLTLLRLNDPTARSPRQ